MKALKQTIVSCFDDPEERRIVRRLIAEYERHIDEIEEAQEADLAFAWASHDAVSTERDFFKSQFEQVGARLEKLQGSL